ncbi:MAG: glycoside hydrolase family 11 protein [Oscillospiraceae bacterium]|nr:glycoside hydrolase family 11 protein [Oscillospiraceae bacterium]
MAKKLLAGILVIIMVAALAVTASAEAVNYSQNWNNGKGTSSITHGSAAGNFSASWSRSSDGFNCVIGRGWNPGKTNRAVGYNVGSYSLNPSGTGCSYISLYGWTLNSLVEYYVVEMWINYRPVEGSRIGTCSSDGGSYDIYKHQQVNQPSISGTQTFWQIFSVRTSQASKNSNNKITFSNHVNAWRNAGFNLGSTHNYQMMAVEGYNSSGSANLTVWDA